MDAVLIGRGIRTAANGVLWLVVLVAYGGMFAGGVGYGILAHARSVSAYGDGSRAWMGIVPIVNLVLFFKRPQDWVKGTSGEFAMNVLGIVFGIALIVLGNILGKVAEDGIGVMAQTTENATALQ